MKGLLMLPISYRKSTHLLRRGLQVAASTGCRQGIRIAMAGHTIIALLDTGAARTLMAEDTFDRICRTTNGPSLIKPSGVVCGLGGQPLPVLGRQNYGYHHLEW